MRISQLHDWNLTPADAVALQNRLRQSIISTTPIDIAAVQLVAGVDVSVRGNESQAAVVVMRFPDMTPVETVLERALTPFPYVPGLLSFREGPVLEQAFARMAHEPDVFIFDGMGIAHPRRLGIAAHLGLWLGKPTIGCGKTRLCGSHAAVPDLKGAHVPLTDRGETIGAVLRSRAGVAPLFISPGHHADISSSVDLVMRLVTRYRLPEPIRAAHKAAGAFTPGD